MAARIAIGSDARERLRRLAAVFSVELRMKIVVELYMREMSAKQFHAEFGGGSATRINQNFSTLAKKDWLRLVRSEGPGGERHGGIEHFYRATELPLMTAESWGLLPYSVRATSSWNMFKQIAPRLRGDIEASNERPCHRRELTCDKVEVDLQGWQRVIAEIDTRFVGLFEEQEDARRRSRVTDESLMRADVFLIAFQSPDARTRPLTDNLLLTHPKEPLIRFSERLAPILEDDVRLEIVSELNRREMSVTQFHREIGGASKPGVSRRFKGLESSAWVAKGQRKTGGSRRGAREQFYRATMPVINDWDPSASPDLGTESWSTFERLCEEIKGAMTSGTFDARANRYLTWSLVRLDELGLKNTIAGIESLSEFIQAEQKRAKARIAKSGEKPITMTVGLAAFEALKELTKAP